MPSQWKKHGYYNVIYAAFNFKSLNMEYVL